MKFYDKNGTLMNVGDILISDMKTRYKVISIGDCELIAQCIYHRNGTGYEKVYRYNLHDIAIHMSIFISDNPIEFNTIIPI